MSFQISVQPPTWRFVTKVTAQAVGRAKSTLVVQEPHLWLCLPDMKDANKNKFLNALVSQADLFGESVENFAQQFSTEAIAQIMLHQKQAAPVPSMLAPWSAPRQRASCSSRLCSPTLDYISAAQGNWSSAARPTHSARFPWRKRKSKRP